MEAARQYLQNLAPEHKKQLFTTDVTIGTSLWLREMYHILPFFDQGKLHGVEIVPFKDGQGKITILIFFHLICQNIRLGNKYWYECNIKSFQLSFFSL